MFLHPSAILADAGVQFVATSNAGYQQGPQHIGLVEWLVQTSAQCTGS